MLTNLKLLISTTCLILLITTSPWLGLAQAQSPVEPTIEKSDTEGITLLWSPPAYTVTDVTINGQTYSRLEMPDIGVTGQPGHPQLPVYSTLIGLPPTGEASLKIVDVQREVVQLPNPLLPAPVPQISDFSVSDANSAPPVGGGKSEYILDAVVYTTNGFYPNTVAQLDSPEQIRDRRVARLSINPLRVNPVTGQMEIVRFVRVEITFSQPATAELSAQQTEPDAFEQTLDTLLLNPEAVTWPAVPSPAPDFGAQGVGAQGGADSIKVRVDSPGLYQITYADLQGAGFGSLLSGVNPKTFQLSYGYPRQEVAIIVEGESDDFFDPGDRILFYAPLRENIYVDYNIYFLDFGGGNGLRMGARSGDPAGLPAGTAWRTATAENNNVYDSRFERTDDDYWYWEELKQPDKTTGTYPVSVSLPFTSGPDATVTAWFQGITDPFCCDPNHKVNVSVNNTLVGTETWEGQLAIEATFPVSASVLQNGLNQVKIQLPGGIGTFVESMWLDELAITYPVQQAPSGQFQFTGEVGQNKYSLTSLPSTSLSLYDITNPDTPQPVTGYAITDTTLTVGDAISSTAIYQVVPDSNVKTPVSFQLAKTVTDPPAGADYVIITHSSLESAIAPLVSHRGSQGLRVVTLNVEKIYDAFGPGYMDAEAIRNALEHAYNNWVSPKPLYVVLIGDGNYDFKNHTGSSAANLIPPYLLYVDPWWGETATDNRLVTFTGGDTLPDMFIGRLSVNTVAEANTVINKIIDYETNPPEGAWRSKHLFVADNQDSAGNFHSSANKGYDELVDSLTGDRYYLSPPTGEGYTYGNAENLKTDLIDAFNQGAGLVTFHGHSSWHQWAIEQLLHIDNFGQLNNQGRLPIVSEMTCFTGLFHHASDQSMDELLVRRAGGGAVAAWGSTGLGVATGHEKLQAGLYQAVMDRGETKLGAATFAGKLKVYDSGTNLDLLDTYTLFGDPAMNFASVFNPDVSITQQVSDPDAQPGDTVTFTLTIKNTGVGTATNVVVNNPLPTGILSPTRTTSFSGVDVSGESPWQLSDLGPNASGTIQIVGVIDPALGEGFSITSIATISSDTPEITVANNSSQASIGVKRVYIPIIIRDD